jgi:hypothetical protein
MLKEVSSCYTAAIVVSGLWGAIARLMRLSSAKTVRQSCSRKPELDIAEKAT